MLEEGSDVLKPLQVCVCDILWGWLIFNEGVNWIWIRLHDFAFTRCPQMRYVARNNKQWEPKFEGHTQSPAVPTFVALIIYLGGIIVSAVPKCSSMWLPHLLSRFIKKNMLDSVPKLTFCSRPTIPSSWIGFNLDWTKDWAKVRPKIDGNRN